MPYTHTCPLIRTTLSKLPRPHHLSLWKQLYQSFKITSRLFIPSFLFVVHPLAETSRSLPVDRLSYHRSLLPLVPNVLDRATPYVLLSNRSLRIKISQKFFSSQYTPSRFYKISWQNGILWMTWNMDDAKYWLRMFGLVLHHATFQFFSFRILYSNK